MLPLSFISLAWHVSFQPARPWLLGGVAVRYPCDTPGLSGSGGGRIMLSTGGPNDGYCEAGCEDSGKQDVKTAVATLPRHSEAFKRDAVRLVTEEGYTFAAAAKAVGVSDQTLRLWRKKFGPAPHACGEDATLDELRAENKRLRQELRRAELEREKGSSPSSGEVWNQVT